MSGWRWIVAWTSVSLVVTLALYVAGRVYAAGDVDMYRRLWWMSSFAVGWLVADRVVGK